MLDKKTLSKQKYIYCVYGSLDHSVHVERFPIIYINNNYVYFKLPGSETIGFKPLYHVKDNLASLTYFDIADTLFKQYFWCVEDSPDEIIKAIKEDFKIGRASRCKRDAEQKLEAAKKKYEEALKEYEKYKDKE